ERDIKDQTLIKMQEVAEKTKQTVAESQIKVTSKLANPNVIDLQNFKVGDVLPNGMKIVNMNPVTFSGKVVVSGKYNYSNDKLEPLYNLVCVEPNQEFLILLPRLPGTSNTNFCFSNQEVVKNKYGPRGSSGEAMVVIDNYGFNSSGNEFFAELIKTLEKN
ncbi:MAG: hypothetical protein NTU97_03955, partial [Candidatus Magasanikbacteria bacterium]|nr:hypothetical protein [Candidatus Magasanikbacteria bacterium]